MAPNPQRNEVLITLGDYSTICRMNFDAIAKIEKATGPILHHIANADNCSLTLTDMINIIELSAINEIDRDELIEAVQTVGVIVTFNEVCKLLLSTYAGVPKAKPTEKKRTRKPRSQ